MENKSFNLIMEIPDSNALDAFNKAREFALKAGWKHIQYVGLILYVRFSKSIQVKEKNFAKCIELQGTKIFLDCVHDDGKEWEEMSSLVGQFLTPLKTE